MAHGIPEVPSSCSPRTTDILINQYADFPSRFLDVYMSTVLQLMPR